MQTPLNIKSDGRMFERTENDEDVYRTVVKVANSVIETSSNVSEKIVVRKSLAPKAEAKKVGNANNDADDTPRPPISAGRTS